MTNELTHAPGVIDRLITDIRAAGLAQNATKALRECAIDVSLGDPQMNMLHKLGDDVNALATLSEASFLQVRQRVYDRAEQAGRLLTRELIAPMAQNPANEQPIVWLTGNSFMPPIRDLEQAERIWQASGDAPGELGAMVWEIFMQAIDHECGERKIYLAAPEYDNALYVVDLARFEHVDEPEGDDLNDEWRPIESA